MPTSHSRFSAQPSKYTSSTLKREEVYVIGPLMEASLMPYFIVSFGIFCGVMMELQLLGSFLDKFTRQINPEKFSCLK
jgi:hypothetical protein